MGKAIECGLAFDLEYLSRTVKPNPLGAIHDQLPWLYKLPGSHQRKLGAVGLCESLHPLVLDRWNNTNVNYRPSNLASYLQEQESAKP